MLALIASMIASGPSAKRPPHMVFEVLVILRPLEGDMRFLKWAVLYTALLTGANAALADTSLEALREGTMRKLLFHSEAQPVSQAVFTTPEGEEFTLSDWQGKHVLVNFWATWCAPCRHEMPALDALQGEFGGDDFEVVTIATGRNTLAGIERFFAEPEEGADPIVNLPILLDPKSELASEMAVLGLPITVVLDPEGERDRPDAGRRRVVFRQCPGNRRGAHRRGRLRGRCPLLSWRTLHPRDISGPDDARVRARGRRGAGRSRDGR